MWARIVGGCCEHSIATIAFGHLSQIGSAETNIALWVGQGVEAGVGQMNRQGDFATGCRQQLHETYRTGTGANISHEQTLTSSDAVSPGSGDARLLRVLLKRTVVRQRIAQ